MPLILFFFFLKIGLDLNFSPPLSMASRTSPFLSLTALKNAYNASFFYACHVLELEHQGDLHGERYSLSQYNPKELRQWFKVINALEVQSDFLPFLVTFYYGGSQNQKILKVCSDFLEQYCDKNPQKNWRWLAYGIVLQGLQNEKSETRRRSKKLSHYAKQYNLPLWAKEAEARYTLKQGHAQEAQALFKTILREE